MEAPPGISVAPNPVRGTASVAVQFASATFADLSVYTPDGRKVKNLLHQYVPAGFMTLKVNFTPYAASNYFLVLKTNEGMIYAQAVKQ